MAGEPASALPMADKAVHHGANGGHWISGETHSALGDHESAVRAYVQADEAGDARGSYSLGEIYRFASAFDLAIPTLQKAAAANLEGADAELAKAQSGRHYP